MVVAAQSFCTFPIRKLGLTARGRIVKIVKIVRKALNKRVYIYIFNYRINKLAI